MNLLFKPFLEEYYAEYTAWFTDPELNRALGPMDIDWLNAILNKPEAAGMTWAVFRETELVAVIETVFDPENRLPAAITALAVKPCLRHQGIGTTVLQHILRMHHSMDITEHLTYISVHNIASQQCFQKIGFTLVSSQPNEHGYLKFRHNTLTTAHASEPVVIHENLCRGDPARI